MLDILNPDVKVYYELLKAIITYGYLDIIKYLYDKCSSYCVTHVNEFLKIDNSSGYKDIAEFF